MLYETGNLVLAPVRHPARSPTLGPENTQLACASGSSLSMGLWYNRRMFSDCDKRGFHGPTHGSKGNVFVYYRNDGSGIVTYLFENRNGFPADLGFAVGDLIDGRFIGRGGCAEVTLNPQSVLRIYRVRNALR
jgi:hypothetical protein